jgi:hypothetical protein
VCMYTCMRTCTRSLMRRWSMRGVVSLFDTCLEHALWWLTAVAELADVNRALNETRQKGNVFVPFHVCSPVWVFSLVTEDMVHAMLERTRKKLDWITSEMKGEWCGNLLLVFTISGTSI